MSVTPFGTEAQRADDPDERVTLSWRQRAATVRRLFPWTRRGVGVLVLAGAGTWWLGVGKVDLIVLAIGATALAAWLALSVAVVVNALWWRHQSQTDAAMPTEGAPRCLETDAETVTGRRVKRLRHWPFLQLDVRWELPRGVGARLVQDEEGVWVERVRPARRFRADQVARLWTVRDVLGLCESSFKEVAPLDHWALPAVGRMRETPIVSARTGADGIPWPTGAPEGDRMEVRRYVPGDSARDVMWNVYARTRQLHVRLRERSVEPSRRMVAYLVAADGDEASAAAARVALESGAFGDDWTFGADGTAAACDSRAAALEAVARSGGFAGAVGMRSFLSDHALGGGASCILFLPPRIGDWLPDVVRQLGALDVEAVAVIGVDQIAGARRPRAAWARFALDPETALPEAVTTEELDEVVRTVAACTAAPPVVVVRQTGRLLDVSDGSWRR